MNNAPKMNLSYDKTERYIFYNKFNFFFKIFNECTKCACRKVELHMSTIQKLLAVGKILGK